MLKCLHFQKMHVSPKSDIYLLSIMANVDFCVPVHRKNIAKVNYMNTCKKPCLCNFIHFCNFFSVEESIFSFPKKKRQREAKLMTNNSSQPYCKMLTSTILFPLKCSFVLVIIK